MRSACVLGLVISDEDSRSEDEAIPVHKKRGLNSGMLQMVDMSVLRKVVCPHKVVYTSTGRPAKYDQLRIPLFISGYLLVTSAEKKLCSRTQ